jgi:hypothetical protein
MPYTPQQAYDAIKNLEAQSKFPIPIPTATINVGTFDAATSTFAFAVPTAMDSYTIPSRMGPNGKPTGPMTINIQVGVVQVNAVDLILTFTVKNPKHNFSVQMAQFSQTISTDPVATMAAKAKKGKAAVKKAASHKVVGKTAGKTKTVKKAPIKGVGGIIINNPLSPRTISLNLGAWTQPPPDGVHPPGVQVTLWSGTSTTQIQLEISLPPIYGAGAFTIPALPMGIVYAPPPGAQNKDYAEYANSISVSTKISTSVSSSTGNKTADAYASSDFAGKITATLDGIKGVISGFGQTGSTWTGLNDFNAYAAAADLGLNLLAGFISDTTSNTTTTNTTTTENDVIVTETDLTNFESTAGLGPGLGDRFVYLRNVKVAYLITNGTLSLNVIGDDGIRGFAAQQLISDLQAIQSSSTLIAGPVTGLDAATIQSLLTLDPFIGNPAAIPSGPRFVQNDPPSAGGNGTGPDGDKFTVTHDITMVDITTSTNVTTTVTDYKPGWLIALFGGAQATENTVSTTYTYGSQQSVDKQQAATVHFFAGPNDAPYLVGLYFDLLFGTFAFTQWSGQLLKKTKKH